MPIIRRTRTRLFRTACGVCLVMLVVVVWSWDASCAHCVKAPTQLASQLHTTTTSITGQTPHAVLNSLVLVLLMMGIMMPETCWDWISVNKLSLLVTSCWFYLSYSESRALGHLEPHICCRNNHLISLWSELSREIYYHTKDVTMMYGGIRIQLLSEGIKWQSVVGVDMATF
jgi:hypothetical protein